MIMYSSKTLASNTVFSASLRSFLTWSKSASGTVQKSYSDVGKLRSAWSALASRSFGHSTLSNTRNRPHGLRNVKQRRPIVNGEAVAFHVNDLVSSSPHESGSTFGVHGTVN